MLILKEHTTNRYFDSLLQSVFSGKNEIHRIFIAFFVNHNLIRLKFCGKLVYNGLKPKTTNLMDQNELPGGHSDILAHRLSNEN